MPNLRLWHQQGSPSWTSPWLTEELPLQPAAPLARQLDQVCDIIQHGVPPFVTAADAARTLAVTLAVRDAARTRSRTLVPLI